MNQKLKDCIDEGKIKKEPAFECNGVNYYEFAEQGSTMSQGRFEAFGDMLAVYDAFKTSGQEMDAYMAQMKELEKAALMEVKANPEKAFDLISQMKEARELLDQGRKYAAPIQKTYDMASFLYIHEDENPFVYDQKLNSQKIKDWKNKPELLGKFLERQLPIFLDVSKFSQVSFLTFTQENLEKKMKSLIRMQQSLNGTEFEQGSLSIIKSQAEELAKLSILTNYLLNNTMESLPKS